MLPFKFHKNTESISNKCSSLIGKLNWPIEDKQKIVASRLCPFYLLSDFYLLLNASRKYNFKPFYLGLITGRE